MNELAIDIKDYFDSPFGKSAIGPGHGISAGTLGELISLILRASFVLAGVGLLLLLIFAGFSIIMGAGKSDPEQAAKGNKAATSALVGFIIVFSAYWIIRIIELVFGVNFITNPGI